METPTPHQSTVKTDEPPSPPWNFTRSLPGAALAVAGTLVALGGGAVLATFGTDGRLASGPRLLSTPTSALVSSVASIKNTSGVAAIAGQPTLQISAAPAHGTAAAFVGIGRAADVNRYLAGASTQEVTDLSVDPYSINAVRHAGQTKPQPPATQHFWAAQSTSTGMAEVNWKIHDGQYRVVIMSANGHTGFATTTTFGIRSPDIPDYAVPTLVLGLLMAAGGTALLIRASPRSRHARSTAHSAASPATP